MNVSDRYAAYNLERKEAQLAHEASIANFENWARPRILQQIDIIKTVVKKENRKGNEENVYPKQFEWAKDRIFNLKISNFTKDTVTVNYSTSPWKDSPAKESFEFPIAWLSLSTWDIAKYVRSEMRAERKRLEDNRLKAKKAEITKIRKTIRENEIALGLLETALNAENQGEVK